MKNVMRTMLAVLATFVAAGTVSAQGGPDIVYIDTQRIMEEAPAMQAVRDSLEQAAQQAEAQITPLQQELQTMAEELDAQQGTMAPEARSQREQAIVEKQQEIQTLYSQLQGQAQQMQQRLMQPVMSQIRAVIQSLREERGYAFVLDLAGSGVLAADPARDITSDVLQRLQATN